MRSKFVAVFLGPLGMGINSMLNETLGLIRSLTSFGITTSAVKNISQVTGDGEEFKLHKIIFIFKRWTWITGFLGFIITLLLAPLLSKLAFGNYEYIIPFLLISITLIFNQLAAGYSTILQGLRKVSWLAKGSVIGSVIGLLVSFPLFYFFKQDGIVPSIIITSVISLIILWSYVKKINLPSVIISRSEFLKEGKSMLALGFMLSMSGLITIISSYMLRLYIGRSGSLEDVGLYGAGYTIINTYVGLIFTALASDYFPRLSLVASNTKKRNDEINAQAEMALLILGPILCCFILFIDWGVILLYSNDFLKISPMLQWAAVGMFFKTASWAMGYLLLAKGASRTFFFTELVSNIYFLLLNFLFYRLFGINGLGISFLLGYSLHFFQNYIILNRNFEFKINGSFVTIFSVHLFLGISSLLLVLFMNNLYAKWFGTFFILLSSSYSLFELNKRLNLFDYIRMLISKFISSK